MVEAGVACARAHSGMVGDRTVAGWIKVQAVLLFFAAATTQNCQCDFATYFGQLRNVPRAGVLYVMLGLEVTEGNACWNQTFVALNAGVQCDGKQIT